MKLNPKAKKILQWILLCVLLFLGFCFSRANAQGCSPAPPGGGSLPPCCATSDMSAGGECMAPATQYQFTIFSFGFEKSDGTVVEFGQPQGFDAASVSSGNDIGNYISGVALTPGTYVAVRPTISSDITAAVQATTRDGRVCSGSITAPSVQPGGQVWPACAAGQPDGTTDTCLSGGQLRIRDDQIGSLSIGGSSSVTINFKFDVNNGAVCRFAPGNGAATGISRGMLSVRMTKL